MQFNQLSGNIITYNDFHYKLDDIPAEFTLVFNTIDEDTESYLMNLITIKDQTKLKIILKCFADEFYTNAGPNGETLPYKLNTQSTHFLPKGEGMLFTEQDIKVNPIVVVISMGSDIVLTLKDKKTQKLINIPIPRRSMFLLQDPQRKYQRGIAKRDKDIIGANPLFGTPKTILRQDRFSIVFESRK